MKCVWIGQVVFCKIKSKQYTKYKFETTLGWPSDIFYIPIKYFLSIER